MTALDQWINDMCAGKCNSALTITYDEFKQARAINRNLFLPTYRASTRPIISGSGECDSLHMVCNRVVGTDMRSNAFESPDLSFDAVKAGLPHDGKTKTQQFYIYMYGVLSTGEAVTIRIHGFEPYFDIQCMGKIEQTQAHVNMQIRYVQHQNSFRSTFRTEVIHGYPATHFHEEPVPFIRVYGTSIYALSQLEKLISGVLGRTFNNKLTASEATNLFMRNHNIQCNRWIRIENMKPYVFDMKYVNHDQGIRHFYVTSPDHIVQTEIDLYRDPTLVVAWDIETFSPSSNSVPLHTRHGDYINLICYDFYWHFNETSLLTIAMTAHLPRDYDKQYPGPMLIVHCNPNDIARMHVHIFERFQPSIMMGFADTSYDWPWIYNSWFRNIINKDGRSIEFAFAAHRTSCYSEYGRLQLKNSRADLIKQYEGHAALKIDAENNYVPRFVPIDGCIIIDMQFVMRRKYSREEFSSSRSLMFFTKHVLQMDTKDDLSTQSPDPDIREQGDNYAELRRIVSAYIADPNDNERISDFIHYCHIDARLCHLMARKIDMINEYRAICSDSFQSLDDIILRAGASKVTNMLLHSCKHDYPALTGHELMYATKYQRRDDNSDEKYGGAFVRRPMYGLEYMTPTTALDFASLYPSIVINFNLCISKLIIHDRYDGSPDYLARAKVVDRLGWDNINEISFDYAGQTYHAWSVKHHGDPKAMGVMPTVLLRLFNDRIVAKEIAARFNEIYNDLLKIEANHINDNDGFYVDLAALVTATKNKIDSGKITNARVCKRLTWLMDEITTSTMSIPQLIEYIKFYANLANNVQLSKKVLMNTFYGTAGASFVFIYNIYIAAAVTAYGRQIIIRTQEFALKHGYDVRYGDTDSMYISRPHSYWQEQLSEWQDQLIAIQDDIYVNPDAWDYARILAAYRQAARKYYHYVISTSIAEAKTLKNLINQYHNDMYDGHSAINIDFEEAGLPALFSGKKAYLMLKHVKNPVLDVRLADLPDTKIPDFMIIRGFDMVKRGFSDMIRHFSNRVVCAIMDPLSPEMLFNMPLLSIVRREINTIYHTYNWQNYDAFAKNVTYKKNVNNVAVQEFVGKLMARHKLNPNSYIPEDGEKFKIVRIPYEYDVEDLTNDSNFDLYGRRKHERASDTMELLQVAKANGIPLNRTYYMDNELFSTINKLIGYNFIPQLSQMEDEKKMINELSRLSEKWVREVYRSDCNLFKNQEVASESRKYLRLIIAEARLLQHDSIMRVFNSMYDVLIGGQHFRLERNNPSALCERFNGDLTIVTHGIKIRESEIKALHANHAGVERKPERDDFAAIIDAAKLEYRKLSKFIIKQRSKDIDPVTTVKTINDDCEFQHIVQYLDELIIIKENCFTSIFERAQRCKDMLLAFE